jgi:hypothetical protein
MRQIRQRSVVAAGLATILMASAVVAATPSLNVDSVNGQTLRNGSVKDP